MFSTISRTPGGWRRTSVATFTSAALVLAAATSAAAEGPDTESVAAAVSKAAPDTRDVIAPDSIGGTLVAETSSGDVALPNSASGDVVITPTRGAASTFSMGLPEIVDGAQARVANDGTVVYDNNSDATVAVQPLGTAVRAATILKSADAPNEYTYEFAGLTPRLNPDGSVTLSISSDELTVDVSQLDAPWAYDANGRPVPTHYRIEGDTVTQVVEHHTSSYAYPVVADPTYQTDCGIITCTARWNREATRNIRDGSGLAGLAVGVASIFVVPLAALVAVLGANAILAGRYYENGNCFGIRYTAALWFPVQVQRGTYNCS